MTIKKDSLGDRMKRHESVSRNFLVSKVPVIIRVDGKAFHTLTRGFEKPFDSSMMLAMDAAAYAVAKEIQGCKAYYVQSDEVSFLLTDYDKVESQGWFDYNQNKLVSLTAAYMSIFFYDAIVGCHENVQFPVFDSRAFNVNREDVANYFLWRMKDYHRNSINMYAQHFFSHKQLKGKNLATVHDMLYGIDKNWAADLSDREKNGMFMVYDKNERDFIRNKDLMLSYDFVQPSLSEYV